MGCQRNISFYKILCALADAVDKLVVAFSNVVTSGSVTDSADALQRGQKLFNSRAHFGT